MLCYAMYNTCSCISSNDLTGGEPQYCVSVLIWFDNGVYDVMGCVPLGQGGEVTVEV